MKFLISIYDRIIDEILQIITKYLQIPLHDWKKFNNKTNDIFYTVLQRI